MSESIREDLSEADANNLDSVINYVESVGVCLYSDWSEACQHVSAWEWSEE